LVQHLLWVQKMKNQRGRPLSGVLPKHAGFQLWLDAKRIQLNDSSDGTVFGFLPHATAAWRRLSTLQKNNWARAAKAQKDTIIQEWCTHTMVGGQTSDYIAQSSQKYFVNETP